MNSILKPLITEKTMAEAEKGKFSFVVRRDSGKKSIRKAIESAFDVNVVSIMTTVVKGKRRKAGKMRQKIAAAVTKKALVQLKAGQKISLFELGA